MTAVITDMIKPNGLAFSPDESLLYVADTGRTHGADHPGHIRVFDVGDDNRSTGGNVFADCTAGLFDGFRLDIDGRIWTSAADGVHCYDPDGTLLGKILVPEVVANCLLRRPQAQPPLHLRHDLALCDPPDDQRRAAGVMFSGARTAAVSPLPLGERVRVRGSPTGGTRVTTNARRHGYLP